MTFGEHLEELRKCLFKAIAGLAIGFIIALSFGSYAVQFIQRPLTRALDAYYEKESIARGQAEGLPGGQITDRVVNQGLRIEERYLDPAELLPELKRLFPEQFSNTELPATAAPKKENAAANQRAGGRVQDDMIRMLLWYPSKEDPRTQIKSLSAQESFTVYVKTSLLVGVLLASWWIIYQIWTFVAAGLYPHERHYVQVYLPFSIGLFLAGAALAFFVVFEPVLTFLLSFNRLTGIAPEPRISEWLGFVLILPVGFGLGFQLPLVMLFLERIGVFSAESYLKQWRIAVLVIFVAAAVITPPDPSSMMLMACSLTLLYFGGIVLCKLLPRHKSSSEMRT